MHTGLLNIKQPSSSGTTNISQDSLIDPLVRVQNVQIFGKLLCWTGILPRFPWHSSNDIWGSLTSISQMPGLRQNGTSSYLHGWDISGWARFSWQTLQQRIQITVYSREVTLKGVSTFPVQSTGENVVSFKASTETLNLLNFRHNRVVNGISSRAGTGHWGRWDTPSTTKGKLTLFYVKPFYGTKENHFTLQSFPSFFGLGSAHGSP